MEEHKRFQKQVLNDEDYKKNERQAEWVRIGGGAVMGFGIVALGKLIKNHAPQIIKGVVKITKQIL